MNKSAGILLPIFSLPSKYGIGCFDESAYRFIDLLEKAGQSYWQILPLGHTGYGNSPYQSFSSFAGNPYFISLDEFVSSGVLTETECNTADFGNTPNKIDYYKQYKNRFKLLKSAYINSDRSNTDFEKFRKENNWLNDYALFMALKDFYGGKPWYEWEKDIRLRECNAVKHYKHLLKEDIEFYKFIQYHFYKQWFRLKKYAENHGIKIIGDIPIYTALDSCDVWVDTALFKLDENKLPIAVAGCPPDGFSAEGQVWGNPIYNWERHKKDGFKWWISRLKHCFDIYDVVRIDHFRGFDEYYCIPFGDKTAEYGHWEKGPNTELFNAVKKSIGEKEIIAEDLGFVTESVRDLVKKCGFMSMKVIEFAFDARDSGSANEYLPHNYPQNCAAYTGTHDNQTIVSWFNTITAAERKKAREYLCDNHTPDNQIYRSFISLIMRSNAKLCIIPMQDFLGFNDNARINIPSENGDNWCWRIGKEYMQDEVFKEIFNMTYMYGRCKKSERT